MPRNPSVLRTDRRKTRGLIPRSPLSTIADITLNAEVEEDPDLYSPMTSRIVHLTIIDALAVGVALARGPKWVSKLEKSKDELRVSRLPR